MRILFMGTPDFAVPCLNALIENNYNVVGVVTQPDKPKGRGKKLAAPPVKQLAIENDIEVYQPTKARNPEFVEQLRNINPDLIIVVAYGHILPADILDIPRLGCVNIHGSLLPKYRGAAPIQWAIINGEKTTGITSMFMDVGMDTGDMILKNEIQILSEDTAQTLFDKLSLLGANTLIDTIKLIEQGKAPREKQNDDVATYAPMLSRETGNIDWEKNSNQIFDLVRGTYSWPGSYTFYKGKKMKIFKVEVENRNTDAEPGTIVEVTKETINVQTGNELILIKEIQVDSGKRMSVNSYLLGNNIEVNEKLGNK